MHAHLLPDLKVLLISSLSRNTHVYGSQRFPKRNVSLKYLTKWIALRTHTDFENIDFIMFTWSFGRECDARSYFPTLVKKFYGRSASSV